jgi:4-amino-4-deoxy-L-arabinose transferase-like glycosyltransferase
MTLLSARSNHLHYLMLAGAIHVAIATVIFLIGHFQVLPTAFDQNGVGLTFAVDGTSYQKVASGLLDEWQGKGFSGWLNARAPMHSRLHSLLFATLGIFLGHNILAVEPLNLFYYLGIVTCIYVLGREVFNIRTGLLAASIVAIWPSFLLHSTQFLRDPLAILCFLALMVVLTSLLTREFSWRRGIFIGIGGVLLVTLFWVTRGNMWNVVLVAIFIAIALLVQRMVQQKSFMTGNAIVMLLIVLATLLVPSRLESSTLPGIKRPATPFVVPSASQSAPPEGIWARAIKQIANRRAGFRSFTSVESNIDGNVRFYSFGDIVRFIPRAAVIGFFAPFPKMWVQSGKSGLAGHLLGGIETLVMYFLYVAAAFSLWRERRNLRMWFLFLVATVGIVALGLVVVNAGALYRIRYLFWMLLIVIAAQGISSYLTIRRTTSTKS